jgi:hypothetical protein
MISRLSAAVLTLALSSICALNANAQTWQQLVQQIALKSGETAEIGDIYWVIGCKSQLINPPEVTVMDGPPGVSAVLTEAMVTPRFQQCPKPVKGWKLKVTAGEIDDQSNSIMTIRIRYKTRDGQRDRSMNLGLALFP